MKRIVYWLYECYSSVNVFTNKIAHIHQEGRIHLERLIGPSKTLRVSLSTCHLELISYVAILLNLVMSCKFISKAQEKIYGSKRQPIRLFNSYSGQCKTLCRQTDSGHDLWKNGNCLRQRWAEWSRLPFDSFYLTTLILLLVRLIPF